LTFDLAYIDICQRGHVEMDIATDLAATGLIAGDVDPSELVVPDRELCSTAADIWLTAVSTNV
jgi:hypothetical protein